MFAANDRYDFIKCHALLPMQRSQFILLIFLYLSFFFQAEDGIRDSHVTGVQTCALPISAGAVAAAGALPAPSRAAAPPAAPVAASVKPARREKRAEDRGRVGDIRISSCVSVSGCLRFLGVGGSRCLRFLGWTVLGALGLSILGLSGCCVRGGGQGGSSAAARGSSPRPGPPHRRSRPLSIAYPPAGRCVVNQSGESRSIRVMAGWASATWAAAVTEIRGSIIAPTMQVSPASWAVSAIASASRMPPVLASLML